MGGWLGFESPGSSLCSSPGAIVVQHLWCWYGNRVKGGVKGLAGGSFWISYVPLLTCGSLRGEGVEWGVEVGYVFSGFG